ncbi:MAG TPA: hypothetical protein VF335_05750, partial [Chitinivibrionales bacterium]
MGLTLWRLIQTVSAVAAFAGFSCNSATNPALTKGGLTFTILDADAQTVAKDSTASFKISIKNNGASAITVRFIKNAIQIPDSTWNACLCIGEKCLPPVIDSIDAATPIAAGQSIDCFLDIVSGTSGS